MTADHPTREERYAATVLPFIRKVCTCHLFSSDREPHNVGCETLVNAHRLAAALVAADPAPDDEARAQLATVQNLAMEHMNCSGCPTPWWLKQALGGFDV